MTFKIEGTLYSYGLTLDNVKLVEKISYDDYLVNGDFQMPLSTLNKNIYLNLTYGWTQPAIEIGLGSQYNAAFSAPSNQIAQLIPGGTQRIISQAVFLEMKNYTLIFDWASKNSAIVTGSYLRVLLNGV